MTATGSVTLGTYDLTMSDFQVDVVRSTVGDAVEFVTARAPAGG